MAVYKDKNGTWYLSVRYVNWQGEHARKVKRGFATKREATEWERSFLLENAGNLDMTFEAFVELYKKNLKERLKLSTWQTKVSIIDTKILPYFKKKKMNDIKVSDVVAWQNTMLNMKDETGAHYSLVYLKTISSMRFFRRTTPTTVRCWRRSWSCLSIQFAPPRNISVSPAVNTQQKVSDLVFSSSMHIISSS